jgi:glycolate oxidase
VYDAQDADSERRARAAFLEVMAAAIELGGTITGEHGVGVLKMKLLERELGDLSLQIHRDIKHALDPLSILNPGKVFDLQPRSAGEGQH